AHVQLEDARRDELGARHVQHDAVELVAEALGRERLVDLAPSRGPGLGHVEHAGERELARRLGQEGDVDALARLPPPVPHEDSRLDRAIL
ncbi:hypothetical protein DF186_16845, partial [Enterococcus hirae]